MVCAFGTVGYESDGGFPDSRGVPDNKVALNSIAMVCVSGTVGMNLMGGA